MRGGLEGTGQHSSPPWAKPTLSCSWRVRTYLLPTTLSSNQNCEISSTSSSRGVAPGVTGGLEASSYRPLTRSASGT
jgi:hypothetical protein